MNIQNKLRCIINKYNIYYIGIIYNNYLNNLHRKNNFFQLHNLYKKKKKCITL